MRQLYLAAAALLSLYAAIFCAIGAENNSSVFLNGTEINDSGFRPDIDGFSFQNYGANPQTVDLTPAELQRMFGDKVCASTAGGKCVLTYPAERWMNRAVSAMKSGHCEGIAVLSSLMYYNKTNPGIFGGSSVIDLSLQDVLLQREIGYWWTTQVTSPGGSRKVLDSPQKVLDTLAAAFGSGSGAGEWWVMGIYLPDGSGGHAITPYAVEDLGNGTARILVYDNNSTIPGATWHQPARMSPTASIPATPAPGIWRLYLSLRDSDSSSVIFVERIVLPGIARAKRQGRVRKTSRSGRAARPAPWSQMKTGKELVSWNRASS
jgi:hypothetical protein